MKLKRSAKVRYESRCLRYIPPGNSKCFPLQGPSSQLWSDPAQIARAYDPPTQNVWIVLYQHKYGIDTWPVIQECQPSEDSVMQTLRNESSEPDEDEDYDIEVRGPFVLTKSH